MSKPQPHQTVICTNPEMSIPTLQAKAYVVQRVSYAGYVWLLDNTHPSGAIGPYVPERFSDA